MTTATHRPLVSPVDILRVQDQSAEELHDLVVVEEPLEIRLGYGPPEAREQRSISVTMRTPGNDLELALGFLFTEGIISDVADLALLEHCNNVSGPDEVGNVVKAELRVGHMPQIGNLQRNFYTTSSCGVCGKASLDALAVAGCTPLPDGDQWDTSVIHSLPELAHSLQVAFRYTGGIHAATLFDVEGRAICSREDVGRHNAVDKVIGAMLAPGMHQKRGQLLFLSGRAGFELVQKAVKAAIPVVASVGAPTSLAVETALRYNLTLIGFVRDGRFNIYAGGKRILAREGSMYDGEPPLGIA